MICVGIGDFLFVKLWFRPAFRAAFTGKHWYNGPIADSYGPAKPPLSEFGNGGGRRKIPGDCLPGASGQSTDTAGLGALRGAGSAAVSPGPGPEGGDPARLDGHGLRRARRGGGLDRQRGPRGGGPPPAANGAGPARGRPRPLRPGAGAPRPRRALSAGGG